VLERLPRKRKKQRRTNSSGAKQEKYVSETFPFKRQNLTRAAHHRTGNSADQGRHEEQTGAEGPRGKAPRYVLNRSHRLNDAMMRRPRTPFRKGRR
jgi:hypothetical protein